MTLHAHAGCTSIFTWTMTLQATLVVPPSLHGTMTLQATLVVPPSLHGTITLQAYAGCTAIFTWDYDTTSYPGCTSIFTWDYDTTSLRWLYLHLYTRVRHYTLTLVCTPSFHEAMPLHEAMTLQVYTGCTSTCTPGYVTKHLHWLYLQLYTRICH